ncbi:hypothetical protein B0H16DRAFT_1733395 [Mycena metata]|uniref:Uncharacterized protein n=1 Tax=Mycena metata TaxID=1033252 RepID=A0AAD7HYF0_9AGAR|nr:hypothetical protein B0H16DRAFT_1733395 [Mycena metata]
MPGGSWTLEEEEPAGSNAPNGLVNKPVENSPSPPQEPYKSEIVTLDAAKLSEEIILFASPSGTSRATIRVRVSPDSDIEEVLPPDHGQNTRESVTRVLRVSPQQRRARCLDIFPEMKFRASPSSTDSPFIAPMADLGWDFPRGSPSNSQDGHDAEEIRASSQDDYGLGLTFPSSSSVDDQSREEIDSSAERSPHLSPSEPRQELKADTLSSFVDDRTSAVEYLARDSLSPSQPPREEEESGDDGGPGTSSFVDERRFAANESSAENLPHLASLRGESKADGPSSTIDDRDDRDYEAESTTEDSPSEPPQEEPKPETYSSVDDRCYEGVESPSEGAAHPSPSQSSREEPRGVDGLGTPTPHTHVNTEHEGNSSSTTLPEPDESDDGLVLFTPPFPTPVGEASRDGIRSALSTSREESGPDDELDTTPVIPTTPDSPSESTSRNSPFVLPSADSSLEDGLSTTRSSPSLAVTSISLPSTTRPSSRSTIRAEVASSPSDSPNSISPPLDDVNDDIILGHTAAVAPVGGHDADSESMSLYLYPATASVLSADDVALNGPGPDVDDHSELEYLDEFPLPPMTPLSFIDVDQLSLPLSLDSSFGLPADFSWEIVQHAEHENDDAGDLVVETGALFGQHAIHDDGAGDLVVESKVKPLQLHFAEPVLESPHAAVAAAEVPPQPEEGGRNSRDDVSHGSALLAPLNGESEDEWLLPPLHFPSPSLTDEVLSSPEFRATTILDSPQDVDAPNSAALPRAHTTPVSRARHTRAFSTSTTNPNAVIERRSIVWAPLNTRYDPDGARTRTLTADAKGKARAGPRPRARTVSDSGFAERHKSGSERVELDDPTEAERLKAEVSRLKKRLRVQTDKVAGLEQQQRDKSPERWEMQWVGKMYSWGFLPSSLEDAIL